MVVELAGDFEVASLAGAAFAAEQAVQGRSRRGDGAAFTRRVVTLDAVAGLEAEDRVHRQGHADGKEHEDRGRLRDRGQRDRAGEVRVGDGVPRTCERRGARVQDAEEGGGDGAPRGGDNAAPVGAPWGGDAGGGV